MKTQNIDSVRRESPDILSENIEQLKCLFPESITEGKIDWDKLKAALGEFADERPERYSFTWAGKRDAIRLLQTPSRATLIPAKEESVNFERTQNIFIEGDNLEVLKLLYKAYFGRVKMIYIDPPYNTGNDFVYPDNYTDPLDTYLKLTGQKDAEGNILTSNPETSGRYHSAWLSMMYPRLFVARQLLEEDGLMFVSIDDHELSNLRVLMNEIFGEESFLACFIWHRRQMADSRNLDRASTDHEYILSYRNPKAVLRGRDIDTNKFSNPDNDPRGNWFSADLTGLATKEQRPNLHYDVLNPKTGIVYHPSPTRGWSFSKETFQKYIKADLILWPSKPDGRPRLKKFLKDVKNFQTGFSSMLDVGFTTEGTREVQQLFGGKIIQFPKPLSLMKALVQQGSSSDDVILDFFAGSCTTAQAVLQLNREHRGSRRFIMVQLPEPLESPQTLEDGTIFNTIADIGKERIRRVIKKIQQDSEGKLDLHTRGLPEDLGFKVFKLAPSNYKPWTSETKPEAYVQQAEMFIDPLVDGWKLENVIYEVAVKEGYGLNCVIEPVSLTQAESAPGKAKNPLSVYRVTDPEKDQSLYITLDETVNFQDLEPLNLKKDDLFICRDRALNDEVAANLALQCRLKTI